MTHSATGPIRLLLVDDHAIVREGIILVLNRQPDLLVVGEAGTPHDALELAIDRRPDVIILDIGLGEQDGVPFIETLLARVPEASVLVLSMFDDAETVRQALLAGAAGYVVKGATSDELGAAIRAVAHGDRYVHSSIAGPVVEDGLRWLRSGSSLTRREREVLSLLAGGKTATAIGRVLGISAHTVRRHLANTAAKLNLHGGDALVRYATKHGLARPAPGSPARVGGALNVRESDT
ncbi:MAG: two-component system, NarL family, response regulator NreC [Chloroflexota bacterium]|nr:two-component system, NarL family, response regulator NreC [Chloroflexota bacterium]